MPGRNRTGPMGQGPRSGRGAGFCGGIDRPGARDSGRGRGLGRGLGRCRGMYWSHPAGGIFNDQPGEEQQAIETEISVLEKQIQDLNQRLNELTDGQPKG